MIQHNKMNIHPSPPTSPVSPRTSDVSFTSAHTTFSDMSPDLKSRDPSLSIQPASTNTNSLPVYPSSSTISRDSHLSNDDRRLQDQNSIIISTNSTRIPKAPVFIKDPGRPGIPSQIITSDMRFGGSQPTTRGSNHFDDTNPSSISMSIIPCNTTIVEKRSISDIDSLFHMRSRNDPIPQMNHFLINTSTSKSSYLNQQSISNVDTYDFMDSNENYKSSSTQIPNWVPVSEHRDWSTLQDDIDIKDIDHENGRWASSMRNLAALYRPNRSPPCVRGSVLDIEPPSFAERWGLAFRSERRHENIPQVAQKRFRYRARRRENERHRLERTNQERLEAHQHKLDVKHHDEYETFVAQPQPFQDTNRSRRGWRRLFLKSKR